MGLIRQCDDQLGVLLDHLEATGRDRDTAIVLTSDHGDYLGDHWLGEKDLFHEVSVKVPLIIADPDPACDAARGTSSDALVEQIDLAPTFVEMAGGTPMARINAEMAPLTMGHRRRRENGCRATRNGGGVGKTRTGRVGSRTRGHNGSRGAVYSADGGLLLRSLGCCGPERCCCAIFEMAMMILQDS